MKDQNTKKLEIRGKKPAPFSEDTHTQKKKKTTENSQKKKKKKKEEDLDYICSCKKKKNYI